MNLAEDICDAIGEVNGRTFRAGSPPDLLSKNNNNLY